MPTPHRRSSWPSQLLESLGSACPGQAPGTLSGLLTGPRRAAHDFDLIRQPFVARAHLTGTGNAHAVRHYLLWREQAMQAEADICGLNQHTMAFWPEVTPDAAFVLTIRDPLEWADALARALTTLIPPRPVALATSPRRVWSALATDGLLVGVGHVAEVSLTTPRRSNDAGSYSPRWFQPWSG